MRQDVIDSSIEHVWPILTSSSFSASVSAVATVVDVVVVVAAVVVVLFTFGILPNINEVAFNASAHPMIPIMAMKSKKTNG